jgi:hypothetical protein
VQVWSLFEEIFRDVITIRKAVVVFCPSLSYARNIDGVLRYIFSIERSEKRLYCPFQDPNFRSDLCCVPRLFSLIKGCLLLHFLDHNFM